MFLIIVGINFFTLPIVAFDSEVIIRPSRKIDRLSIAGGWFMTPNIMAKLEYVNQNYSGDGWNGSSFQGAEFNGIVLEAAISF